MGATPITSRTQPERASLEGAGAAARRLERLDRALAVLRGVGRAVVAATDETAFLTDICQLVVDLGGYRLAWVGLAERDEERRVRPAARAGADADYVDGVDVTWSADDPRGQGPTGTAIRERRPVVMRHPETDPRYRPWRDAAHAHGFGSAIAVPFVVDESCVGALNLYASQADAFDDDEVRLVTELAAAVGHGVSGFRAQTDRIAAVEALRESGQRFRQIMENIREVFWMVSADTGELLYVSPACEQLWGLSREALYKNPRTFLDLVDEADRDETAIISGTGRVPNDTELRLRLPDGRVRWVRHRTFPVKDGSDEVVRIAGVSEDITERKEADLARTRLEAELEQARRLESVGQLAGGVAHDFNNLLAVILNYGEVMRRRLADDDPLLDDVSEIEAAAERGATLVRQLLLFSRRDVVRPEIVDLNELVTEMERLLGRTLGEDIGLELRLAKDLWPVEIGYASMEQVLLNLVVNARDAMLDGGHVEIATANVAAVDGLPAEIELTVTDDGAGMSEEVQARAFEPFFTTKGVGAGSGMGLSMAYGVVTRAGGRLHIESTPGRGTRVAIRLPTASAPAVAKAPTPAAEATRAPGGHDERILLVEDEAALRSILARILSENGYRVLPAASPGEALLLAERETERIDMVLTDVVLPLMSGPELAGRLSALAPGLPILFMSGYAESQLVERAGLDPDAERIEKPFHEADLLEAVRKTLAKGGDGR